MNVEDVPPHPRQKLITQNIYEICKKKLSHTKQERRRRSTSEL
ncbi:MAG: hypothetical protein RSC87_04820 [Muribaculaceae bacterium]